MACTDEQL
ncbi:hypothetical protein RDI58_019783 [Solanum bulbocastanum]|uniref:Uncharacterized protein n=1 Tax=Solanum bulbocastanum TaxID=147425 RepID=A0AAN8TBJ3_SOLBU